MIRIKFLAVLLGCAGFLGALQAQTSVAPMRFQHFTIQEPLPGTGFGTAGIPLADFDGDGDLDCALSRRDAHGFWWYERRSDALWVQHVISLSTSLPQGLGCAAVDVDNDGWPDVVFDGVWFKNPGTLKENPDSAWTANVFAGAGHDILAADLNGDGRPDLAVFDGNALRWFNPAAGMVSNTVVLNMGHHGGLTPKGAGDLDGDGDLDLVIAGAWFENPGNGLGTWVRHAWPHLIITNASYGTSIRSWVVDLDGDGDQDIVYSDCDTGFSHVYWVRNEGHGTNWTRFALPDPPTSPGSVLGTGSFHSLCVADFDLDGKLDIFAGEQEDPDQIGGGKLPMKPAGLKERGVMWRNVGGSPPQFSPQVIQEDNPGWHDTCVGDVDGDGDLDLVTKVWNKDGVSYHADYWRNDTIVQLDNGLDLSGWKTNGGLWQVIDGAIVGQQNPPGSGNGGLLLSAQSYGDFEANFEVWPDWGVDTGFYTRTTTNEKAYQITIDYQTNNPMGGIYLAGVGDYGFWDFTITGTNSIQGNPQYFTVGDWPNIWNPSGWNRFRVLVSNNPPHLVTWINGTKIKDYQDTQVRLPASGKVALQVHPTAAEWPLGAVTRFRNIRIQELGASGSVADTEGPSIPSDLSVRSVSSSSVMLGWSASSDNVGVSGYRVYRNGVEAGTCATSSFTDAGLAANTLYSYTVRAFDAATNQSGASAVLQAHTRSGASTGAVPSAGLAFWVKADTGLSLSGGSVVQWADQSGNNRHATQSIAAYQPMVVSNGPNAKAVLRFDGLNDFLNFNLPLNGATGLTLVLVSACSTNPNPGANQGNCAALFWDETASWGWTYLSPFPTNVFMRFGTTQSANLFKYQRPGSISNRFSVTVGLHNGTTDLLYINGSLALSAPGKLAAIAATVSTPYLGRGAGSTFFPGDIAEVLVYSRALTGAERQDVEAYARRRYLPELLPAIQLSSPTNHSSFVAPTNLTIEAAAFSSNSTISQVEFLADGILIGQKSSPPYSLTWSNVGAGSYELSARAIDGQGLVQESGPVLVVVTESPGGVLAPELEPLADRQAKAGVRLVLNAVAHDPNTPPQGLSFSLGEGPPGATIDASSGELSWRPGLGQIGSSNRFSVVVRQPGGWQTNLLPVADGYVLESYPNANYGAQANLIVKLSASPGLTREAFLRFALGGLSGSLTQAVLQLVPSLAVTPGTHGLGLVSNNSWDESLLNWATKPPSWTLLGTWVPQETVPVQVPLLGAVQSALSGDGLLSVRLFATNSTADGLVYYGSKEGALESAPRLLVGASGPSLSATQSFWVSVEAPARPFLSGLSRRLDGQVRLVIGGEAGADYILQSSSNLLDWSVLFSSNLTSLPYEFVDASATNERVRFYRALLGP